MYVMYVCMFVCMTWILFRSYCISMLFDMSYWSYREQKSSEKHVILLNLLYCFI